MARPSHVLTVKLHPYLVFTTINPPKKGKNLITFTFFAVTTNENKLKVNLIAQPFETTIFDSYKCEGSGIFKGIGKILMEIELLVEHNYSFDRHCMC